METEKKQNDDVSDTKKNGIYSKVTISVPMLDGIIVCGICAIALLVLINL